MPDHAAALQQVARFLEQVGGGGVIESHSQAGGTSRERAACCRCRCYQCTPRMPCPSPAPGACLGDASTASPTTPLPHPGLLPLVPRGGAGGGPPRGARRNHRRGGSRGVSRRTCAGLHVAAAAGLLKPSGALISCSMQRPPFALRGAKACFSAPPPVQRGSQGHHSRGGRAGAAAQPAQPILYRGRAAAVS